MAAAGFVVAAFLLGSLPFSAWLGKAWGGVDLREVGSRNPGATNLLRAVGKGPALVALLLDVTKGAVPVGLARAAEVGDVGVSLSAVAAILGHVLSPFLRMRGGKGVATSFGALLVLSPRATLVGLLVFLLAVVWKRYVSLASILAAAAIAGCAVAGADVEREGSAGQLATCGVAGILGAGSWGTALAVHLASAGNLVTLWARRQELARALTSEAENRTYLPGVSIPDAMVCTSKLEDLAGCDPILVVVPSHGFRQVVRDYLVVGPRSRSVTLISATKGVETETLARMSQVAAEEAELSGRVVHFALLSGPTFAAELARDMPSAAVVASEVEGLSTRLRELLATPTLRLYSSRDVVGVELGGAAKNVIAVGAGILHGLGLGYNTQAALITRGLHEITRLGLRCGGEARTLSGLAGLGDLVLTCTGGLSRNRQTGIELARGKSLAEIQAETSMVAEGVKNSLALSRLAQKLEIEMPITEQMRAVIYDGKSPALALEELMARERKAESKL